jgi:hypothetical protein
MQFTFAFGAKIKKIVGWEKEKEIKKLQWNGGSPPRRMIDFVSKLLF